MAVNGRRTGLGLLEALLALALTVVVLSLVARHLHAARGAERAVRGASEARATTSLALDLLSATVTRAGTAPWPRPAGATPTPGPGLVLTVRGGVAAGAGVGAGAGVATGAGVGAGAGDVIALRFQALDASGEAIERWYHLDVATDGRGASNLYRRTHTGVRQPWVEGITRLTLAGWVDGAGLHDRAAWRAGSIEAAALLVEVRAGDAHGLAVVPLPGRPTTRVEVEP